MIFKGYHGTSRENANQANLKWEFENLKSESHLGYGVYFFVDEMGSVACSNANAYPFSKKYGYEKTKVVCTDINLQDESKFFDLDDEYTYGTFQAVKKAFVHKANTTQSNHMIKNESELDAHVIRYLQRMQLFSIIKKTISAPHVLTKKYPYADDAQCICVMDLMCIDRKTVRIVREELL